MNKRRLIVTGGGSGQGRATALELDRAGYALEVFDVDEDSLTTLVSETGDERTTGHVVDVTDYAAVATAMEIVASKPGGFDGLLLCAGIIDRSTLAEGDPARWRKVLDVNILGVLHCLRAGLPHLMNKDLADVVVWGSVSGLVRYTHESVYAASKAAVTHLFDCLRLELAETNVRVTVLQPGLVDTPMTRSNPTLTTKLEQDPLTPEDIARSVRFILEQPSRCNVSEIVFRTAHQTM